MTVSCFVDTNVLLYAISADPLDRLKRRRAQELLRTEVFGVSVQVLQEFHVNAIRGGAAAETIDAVLDEIRRVPVVEIGLKLFDEARQLQRRYRISYWDAAIVAAAAELGAATIYSEDLSHGQKYGAPRVVNPFL